MANSQVSGTNNAELPRQFSLFSTMALGFSITNSWLAYAGTFATPLTMGGSPTAFFGLIVASIASCFITAGFAELASAFPSSGGPYHYAFMVSWEKHRAPVAFVVGWLSVIAWCAGSASNNLSIAQMAVRLVTVYHRGYTEAAWHTYLIYLGITVFATTVVCFLPRAIPRLEIALFLCSVFGFIASLVTMLAVQAHKQSAHTVFVQYENNTGWSDGTAFMIGTATCMYAYLAIDGATHIAEEVTDPSRNVPQAVGLTVITGILTAIPWTISLLFCTTDNHAVASSPIPIYTAYLQATSSRPTAAFFTVWIMFLFAGAYLSGLVTVGRLTYAFARADGLPYSPAFTKITNGVPIEATIACSTFIALYGLIYIASTTAFNSFISMCIISLNVTYVIPQGIVLIRGRESVLPHRAFAMGKCLGGFCNAFSVLWVSMITVLFCLPLTIPTTVQDMNYVSVVIAAAVAFIVAAWWGGKRQTFCGPVCLSPCVPVHGSG
ncbi:amino acid transporter [Aspergillus heteromorphus CBS 117.55]|uniref:Amino acid transporter n=1 Tax=Aspergillus heteromorphus CBS 117.55 TaxID=1448321 RepID=A0A317V5X5_9EURO|nr:amino acid transporter [Aspergillus heteromorphus CBS 117.55]PWY69693.1 amino acid transporter [Aspergillus heteromorphus CBS 117.55]